MIEAVIFDMDGLLIDSEPLWQKTVIKVYKTIGIKISEEEHNLMRGRTTLENAQYFFAKRPWQGPSPKELADLIINDMVELVKTDSKLMPGVDKVIQTCRDLHLPIAIASSSPVRLIDAVVDALKIREHFNHIYSAQFEEYGKPHPAVFISAAKKLKADPSRCLVFEDSPAGVLAAKAASMKCVAVPAPENVHDKFIQTADVILNSLENFDSQILQT